MLKVSVLASGGGTNFQAIIDAVENGEISNVDIVQLIASSDKAYALERARAHKIKSRVIRRADYSDKKQLTEALLMALENENTDLVVLAGYMSVLAPEVIKEYRGRIINIHPSLIPKYCGKGFYGMNVHRAVVEAGEKESGATVHYVDEGVDTGEMIVQERVPVYDHDTAEDVAARVLLVEHQILPMVIGQIAEGILGQ